MGGYIKLTRRERERTEKLAVLETIAIIAYDSVLLSIITMQGVNAAAACLEHSSKNALFCIKLSMKSS